jgi:phytoene synthase
MRRPTPEASAADLAACRDLLRRKSRSFAAASLLLPRRVRDPSAAIYGFCRQADDVVDLGGGSDAVAGLRRRLARAYAGSPVDAPVDRAFAQTVREHEIPRALVEALVDGFAWDAEGRRYQTLSDLTAYAVRVAGTVGAMMTVLMGTRAPEALARAVDLGVAMQLTNIARDVGEDARAGRLYLPLAWLDEAGVDARSFVADPRPSPGLAAVVERLLRHAGTSYVRADPGIALLPADCRAAIRAARLIYADIGREVARRGFDAVSGRAVVSGRRKLWLVARALVATDRGGEGPREPALAEAEVVIDAVAGIGSASIAEVLR